MRTRQLVAIASLLSALAGITPSAWIKAASFQGLGYLQGTASSSEAGAVSGDGTTIVGVSALPKGGDEAFLWTSSGGMIGLGSLSGGTPSSDANAVSYDGSVVVGYSASASGEEAFLWTKATGMTGLGDLPGGDFDSRASGLSADGSVVVGTGNYSAGGGPKAVTGEAFRWTSASGLVGLGDILGGTGVSRAFGVSADGSVVVGKGNAGSSFQVEDLGVAYRWTAADGMQSLGFLPGGSGLSAATAVSADGSVVVGYSRTATGVEAFRWTQTTGMLGLGTVPGTSSGSYADAISDNGVVVVGRNTSASGDEAFLWDEVHGMRGLQDVLSNEFGINLAGWSLHEATGISADGRVIAGFGSDPSGNTEAWRVEIPASLVWKGAAQGDNQWSTAANWGGETPQPGAYLYFGVVVPNGHASNFNNLTAGTQLGSIAFVSGAPSYNLQGNSIKLGGGVINSSSQDQVISLDMQLVAGGGLFDDGGKTLTLSGSISGLGPLTKEGQGTLFLSGNNSYTGGTFVDDGTLEVTSRSALPDGTSLTVAAGGKFIFDPSAVVTSSPQVAAVPEPGALLLFCVGAIGLLFFGWRRRGIGREDAMDQ